MTFRQAGGQGRRTTTSRKRSRIGLAGLLAAVLATAWVGSGCPGVTTASAQAQGPTDIGWVAGNYAFSDELGGFTIRAVSGRGTRDDPIVIQEELHSASPVTLVIRASFPNTKGSGARDGDLQTGALYLAIAATNGSGLPWVEFEFELQELPGQPSIFGDGLSFDQRREHSGTIGSSTFKHFDRDLEPFDRVRFSDGSVDAGKIAQFSFALTDFTPRWQFYLVQDPRIPAS